MAKNDKSLPRGKAFVSRCCKVRQNLLKSKGPVKGAGKMRCCEKSGWPLSVKGGEAEVDKFLLKFLVCVVILALALSIKAC